MNCGNKDKFYSLAPEATSDCPKSIEELKRWLSDQDKEFSGKLYVASSIRWMCKEQFFRQEGCSPNYLKRRWTLACCKHPMRSSAEFRVQVKDRLKHDRPYFIFTLASKKGSGLSHGGQALVSVARVTKTFTNMQEYAGFLCRQSQAIKLSRLTRQPADDNYKGWRFGDCHANDKGVLDSPDKKHVHRKRKKWTKDRDSKGLILFSDHFLIWKKPEIVSRETICRTTRGIRLGIDISSRKTLREFLADV